MQYDVFISCKSDDYPFARKVYQYLKGQNYKVFLADAELRKKGNTEYGKIIDEALDSATHMIIIASKPEYINSSYVQSEWRTFIEEKRTGRKTGNIVTITENFKYPHYQSVYVNLNHLISNITQIFAHTYQSKTKRKVLIWENRK